MKKNEQYDILNRYKGIGDQMNTVSILLKEARPLYFKRKTRMKTLKKGSFIAVLMCFMVGHVPRKSKIVALFSCKL